MKQAYLHTLFVAISSVVLAFSLIFLPAESLEASKRGLHLWWEVVFPSLFPFFIVTELLISFGVVKAIGVLFEPFMKPLFKVPGIGSFVWVMGLACGNPGSAKITSRLRTEKQLTKLQAERLIASVHSSSPLFIFAAVSAGFFQQPALGLFFAISHYGGSLIVGLCMRFYGKDTEDLKRSRQQNTKKGNLLKETLQTLHHTRLAEKRPIGKLLGDSIVSTIQTLLLIGGFIILFSVINKMLYVLGVTSILAYCLHFIFGLLQIPNLFNLPFISGLFEVTIGSELLSQSNGALLIKVMLTSFLLGFGGLSIQAQVASIIADTDISFKPFFIARFFHATFSAILVLVIWEPLHSVLTKKTSITAFFNESEPIVYSHTLDTLAHFGPIFTLLCLFFYVFILAKNMLQQKK